MGDTGNAWGPSEKSCRTPRVDEWQGALDLDVLIVFDYWQLAMGGFGGEHLKGEAGGGRKAV